MLEKILNRTKNFGRAALLATALLMPACTKPVDETKPVNKPTPADSIHVDHTIYSLPVTFFNSTDLHWINYSPTNFNPNVQQYPSESSIREDLKTLVDHGYNSIDTYGSDNILGQVPQIAKSVGIKGVVMGIWDPTNSEEFNNAVKAKDFVDGYCIGNEGLTNGRYNMMTLKKAADSLRTITNKPVTTTEPSTTYTVDIKKFGDWIFPNAHPYWSGIKEPRAAAKWTKQKYDDFSKGTDKVVVLKEVGLPSAGETGLSEANQNLYYNTLDSLMTSKKAMFSYFEAFDQPWKNNLPVEPYWGLFDKNRQPKEVAKPQIIITSAPAMGGFENLYGKVRNVLPDSAAVSTYIDVAGTWWVKPYWSTPLSTVKSDGSWGCDVTTGGIDQTASKINVYLVTKDFDPNSTNPSKLPPVVANDKVKSYVIINR